MARPENAHREAPGPRSSDPRGVRTRTAIIDAAAAVVVESGWSAATARAVAARAAVPLGSVSYHFPSKQDLLREAVLAEFARVFAAPVMALSEARTLDDALASQLTWLTSAGLTADQRRFLLEMLLGGARDARLGEVMADALAGWRAGLADALGRLAPHLPDPDAVGAALAAALSGFLVHTVADPTFPAQAAATALRGALGGAGPVPLVINTRTGLPEVSVGRVVTDEDVRSLDDEQ